MATNTHRQDFSINLNNMLRQRWRPLGFGRALPETFSFEEHTFIHRWACGQGCQQCQGAPVRNVNFARLHQSRGGVKCKLQKMLER